MPSCDSSTASLTRIVIRTGVFFIKLLTQRSGDVLCTTTTAARVIRISDVRAGRIHCGKNYLRARARGYVSSRARAVVDRVNRRTVGRSSRRCIVLTNSAGYVCTASFHK